MHFTFMNTSLRAAALLGALALAGCASAPETFATYDSELDAARLSFAMSEVEALQSKGARVWCVPFARNLSGVDIRGNARTWWSQAQDSFGVSKTPAVGAVMAF
ncbi:CHAP domain-containing protein, partial [Oceanicola sp. S124]|uniref:CHAP domain-containing protein n=1 Tax=Oceanicola sp. S124 TaxID=1042378 RepID=UPI00110FE6C5